MADDKARATPRIVRWMVRTVGLMLLGTVLGIWLMPERTLGPLAQFLDVSETPGRVDYVLVLNGDPETRPFAAAAMVRSGLAKKVLLTRQRLALESVSVRD